MSAIDELMDRIDMRDRLLEESELEAVSFIIGSSKIINYLKRI